MVKESKRSIQFHVDSGDYFGTLGTVLDLLRQDIEQAGCGRRGLDAAKLLEEVREDLLYLQEEYRIMRRLPAAKRLQSR
jgi:hypothetical protein